MALNSDKPLKNSFTGREIFDTPFRLSVDRQSTISIHKDLRNGQCLQNASKIKKYLLFIYQHKKERGTILHRSMTEEV